MIDDDEEEEERRRRRRGRIMEKTNTTNAEKECDFSSFSIFKLFA